jgi:anti-sigma-K factor RskA
MTINIEKLRFDRTEQQRQRADQQKWETRTFLVSAILATAAAVGAGVGNLIWAHRGPPPPPQPIVIQLPQPAK